MFNVKWVLYYLKGLIFPCSLVLGVQNVKTTYKKSLPENVFQVSNLTLTPALRSNEVIILIRLHISLIIGPRYSERKTSRWEVMICKCFAFENCLPHVEKQNGRHS